MSLRSRIEYLAQMQDRYRACMTRREMGQIIEEVVQTLGYNRKYAIRCLNGRRRTQRRHIDRRRPRRYQDALPAIQKAWEALDYPCAERLHPVLPETAEHLAGHEELYLDDGTRHQL